MAIFNRADILLPKNADMTKWSVVACDQYTSEREYWEKVDKFVGDEVSTSKLILPEVYLGDSDVDSRIEKINSAMLDYLDSGVFSEYKNSYIYVERTLSNGNMRAGVVGCVDLEQYDYRPGSRSAIRATEKTVTERIPPRLKVRSNAALELPHVMLLIDDDTRTIIESLAEQKPKFKKLYDFDLMMNSGHITGWIVNDDAAEVLEDRLEQLADREYFENKYHIPGASPLAFAVGDGNHSLATAKEYCTKYADSNPLARYALVELVNLHDDSLVFEPIHRVIFGADNEKFEKGLVKLCEAGGNQKFTLIADGKEREMSFANPTSSLTVGSVQNYIDSYIAENSGSVDYIHGEDVVRSLVSEGNIGILLPAMDKNDLFKTVISDGALPRKTFSMGEAEDKRFYIEARAIR